MSGTYYKQNRIKKLRAFCHTAKLGSVTKAADKLFASQPTVSLQIKALEEEMSVQLFERRGPYLKLTSEGEILYKLALPLVQGVDQLQETFNAHCGKLSSGELTIAAGESTILYILPEPVRQFSERYPDVRLTLANVTGRDGMAMLRADQADFAVGSMLEVPQDVEYTSFVSYDPVLITPLDHPLAQREKVTLHDISPHGLILPPRHLSTWRIVKMVFAQNNVNYNVALEAGGWEVIKRYVSLGMGISIVTDVCLTEEDRKRFAVINLSEYFPKRTYGIVTRRERFLSAPAKRFIELMEQQYSQYASEALGRDL
ncbi:LysR family transcriptional regulator [Granulosicoccaceae sp. 1_MG-2023]|nr:LysR family transcriptional regulator [Granulosicoccaceae sp. 1_MG-2023]